MIQSSSLQPSSPFGLNPTLAQQMTCKPAISYATARSTTPLANLNLPAGVWRASEQAPMAAHAARACPTQHARLDAWLPGGGWPIGSLTEILVDAPGCGEIALIAPALAALPTRCPIVLLNPPAIPNALAWQQWQIPNQRLWWLHPKTLTDAWWSAETVLRARTFAALLAWLDPIDDKALRRLHACVQDTQTLVFLFRPKSAAIEFSPSPLRLLLTPGITESLSIEVFKCKGNRPGAPIALNTRPPAPPTAGDPHVDSHRTLAVAP